MRRFGRKTRMDVPPTLKVGLKGLGGLTGLALLACVVIARERPTHGELFI